MFVDLEKAFDRVLNVDREFFEKERSDGMLREGSDEDISGDAISDESGR